MNHNFGTVMRKQIMLGLVALSLLTVGCAQKERTFGAQQTVLGGTGVYWGTERAKINANFTELYTETAKATKEWVSGKVYTTNNESVVHGGKHYICSSGHTADSTTEPGVGASWATVWAADVLGNIKVYNQDTAPVSCVDGDIWVDTNGTTGQRVSTCEESTWVAQAGGSGDITYPLAGVPTSTGEAWGDSYAVGTGANELLKLNESAQIPAVPGTLLTATFTGTTLSTYTTLKNAIQGLGDVVDGSAVDLTFGDGFDVAAGAVTLDLTEVHVATNIPKCITISAATSASDFVVTSFPYAVTVGRIRVTQIGATNVIGGVDECLSSGAACGALDSDITATTAQATDDGALTDAAIAANGILFWHTTSVSGTNGQLMVCVDVTAD